MVGRLSSPERDYRAVDSGSRFLYLLSGNLKGISKKTAYRLAGKSKFNAGFVPYKCTMALFFVVLTLVQGPQAAGSVKRLICVLLFIYYLFACCLP
jgi:hypothetical protein